MAYGMAINNFCNNFNKNVIIYYKLGYSILYGMKCHKIDKKWVDQERSWKLDKCKKAGLYKMVELCKKAIATEL